VGSDPAKVDPNRARTPDRYVVEQLFDQLIGCDEKTKQFIHQEQQRFAADLAGPNPSPIERVLADTAAVCWFSLRLFETQDLGAKGLTLRQSEHQQRRIDRAHRRLLATLRLLVTARRLGVPAIQVNLAQQVNVTGSG
jgi:hypothetical protein